MTSVSRRARSSVPARIVGAVLLLGPVGSEIAGPLPATVTSLPTTTVPGPWGLVGACAGLGVLLGVLRAAIVARRRPVTLR